MDDFTPNYFRQLWGKPDGAATQVYTKILDVIAHGNCEVTGLEKFQPEIIAAIRTKLELDGWSVTGDAVKTGRWIIVPQKSGSIATDSTEGSN